MSIAVNAGQDKLVSAVCHGPAAFTEAELNGKPLVEDKKVALPRITPRTDCKCSSAKCSLIMRNIASEPEECAGA